MLELYTQGQLDLDGLAASSRARALSALSSFYNSTVDTGLKQLGIEVIRAKAQLDNAQIAARGRPVGRVGYSMYLFELP